MKSVVIACSLSLGLILTAFSGLWGQDLKTGSYPDGSLRYKGFFKAGRPVGELLRYYPDGKMQACLNHRGDTVEAVLYSHNGESTSCGIFVRKLKTGNWEYRRGKILLLTEMYADGLLQGMAVRYFASGRPAEKKQWRQGVPDGEWMLYYNNGQVRMQTFFLGGKLNGSLKAYDYDGNLQTEGSYKDGLKEGCWRFYGKQGDAGRELKYHKGVPENADEFIRQESRKLDALVEQGKKIPDPAVFADDPDLYLKVSGIE